MNFSKAFMASTEKVPLKCKQISNKQVYFIPLNSRDCLSIIHMDDGEYKQCSFPMEYWEYGYGVLKDSLEELHLTVETASILRQLLTMTDAIADTGLAPVCIYQDSNKENNDAILICTKSEPHIYYLMNSLSFAYINGETLKSLHHEKDERNTIRTRYYISIDENGIVHRDGGVQ